MQTSDKPKVELSTMTTTPSGGPIAASERATAKVQSVRYVFRKMTWRLFAAWIITALINIIFGYETTSFSGLQSIPAFAKKYGAESDGAWALSPARASYTASSAFGGKLLGSLVRHPPIYVLVSRLS